MFRIFVSEICSIHDYLYAPKLDGTESISQISGTTSISNNELHGGSGYLSTAWDNTGNWEVSFKAKWGGGNCAIGLFKPTETSRDNNGLVLAPYNYSLFAYVNGTGTSNQQGSSSIPYNNWYDVKFTKNGSTITMTCNGITKSITWSLASTLSTMCIGVDTWGHTAYIKEIVVKPL